MANPVIRAGMLELFAGGDFTVTALAERLAVPYNSAAKAISRAREEREVHVCGYAARAAAIYRLGPSVDVARPVAPDPVVPAEERHDARGAKVRGVVEQAVEYFEMPDLLPGVRHFTCSRYRATLSVQSCSERWTLANEGTSEQRQNDRMKSCVNCVQGALHANKSDLNVSPWKGSMRCARCGEFATRLIGRHLCLSDYNRQREVLVGANRKGTRPIKIGELNRRSVSYFTAGKRKVKSIQHTTGLEEVLFSVLRDEVKTVKFGGINEHPAVVALRDNPDLDFSISDDVGEAVQVAVAADGNIDVPVSAALDIVQADPAADVEADVVGHTVDPLRGSPIVAPVPTPQPFYSASLFAD